MRAQLASSTSWRILHPSVRAVLDKTREGHVLGVRQDDHLSLTPVLGVVVPISIVTQ